MTAITMNELIRMSDNEKKDDLSQKLDILSLGERFAGLAFGAILLFLFAHLWMLKGEVAQVQMSLAELRGQQSMLVQTLRDFQDKGSNTAQQLKVMLEDMRTRLNTMEIDNRRDDHINKEDWNRLESRVRDLERGKR